MIETNKGYTVTNYGATVIELLDLVHPAARIMADIAKAQDDEVGDGTTSVILIAGEILRNAKDYIEEGMSPQIIIKGFKMAQAHVLKNLENMATPVDVEDNFDTLVRCGETSLNSKLLAHYKTFFAEMVVEAVKVLDIELLDKSLIGIKHVSGGSVRDSQLVKGVAFKKTFSYAGFEQAPKKFSTPKILVLNIELELKAEKESAEVRIENPQDYQALIDAEWELIYEKLRIIVESGANIVLSRLPIGDLATQFFADRDVSKSLNLGVLRWKSATRRHGQSRQGHRSQIADHCQRTHSKRFGNLRPIRRGPSRNRKVQLLH